MRPSTSSGRSHPSERSSLVGPTASPGRAPLPFPIIYLDNNATTQPSPAVNAAVQDALATGWHNPSSIHRPGQSARQQVELARQALADLIGVKARELTFTSSGTESVDLAIRGCLGALSGSPRQA